jgi:hypothetical protein
MPGAGKKVHLGLGGRSFSSDITAPPKRKTPHPRHSERSLRSEESLCPVGGPSGACPDPVGSSDITAPPNKLPKLFLPPVISTGLDALFKHSARAAALAMRRRDGGEDERPARKEKPRSAPFINHTQRMRRPISISLPPGLFLLSSSGGAFARLCCRKRQQTSPRENP